MLRIIGEDVLSAVLRGEASSGVATIFPEHRTLVTIPGIHDDQRRAMLDQFDRAWATEGKAPLTDADVERILLDSVSLFVYPGMIAIRPDPTRMDQAYLADELLRERLPKSRIRFLDVADARVRHEIFRRGEAWRINPLPVTPDQIVQHIVKAQVAVGGERIYYYNAARGTRYLTASRFQSLAKLSDASFRSHILEIGQLLDARNDRFARELDLFPTDVFELDAALLRDRAQHASDIDLRLMHADLSARFLMSVPPELREDEPGNRVWRERMHAQLTDNRGDVLTETAMMGLAPEFYRQILWLPGARISDGELIFDSELDSPSDSPAGAVPDTDIIADSDRTVRSLICNILQENGHLEYVNIGRVVSSLCQRTPDGGRREVYVAHFRREGDKGDQLQIIRLQKWGVRERLNQNADIVRAIWDSEEYTDYILDRRLGCRQLGMNLPPTIHVRKFAESYTDRPGLTPGNKIWTTYFQRPYVDGIASDKIPTVRLANDGYASALADLLGEAAASNLIVGRTERNGHVIFDDGDEMIVEGPTGLPERVIVSDHTGTFENHHPDGFRMMARAYARSIISRAPYINRPRDFGDRFLAALERAYDKERDEYLRRRTAYRALFRHRPLTDADCFHARWLHVLDRLEAQTGHQLAGMIRDCL